MPIPASYTEATLATYMQVDCLKAIATVLGWTTADRYQGAIDATLEAYGVGQITEAVNIPKLRAIARLKVWEAVVDETVADYDYSADGASFSRSQIHKQAQTALALARRAARHYHLAGGSASGESIPVEAVY